MPPVVALKTVSPRRFPLNRSVSGRSGVRPHADRDRLPSRCLATGAAIRQHGAV